MHAVTIEKLDSGYVIREIGRIGRDRSAAAQSVEEAFRKALFYLEGKAPTFGGSLYGDVRVTLDA